MAIVYRHECRICNECAQREVAFDIAFWGFVFLFMFFLKIVGVLNLSIIVVVSPMFIVLLKLLVLYFLKRKKENEGENL